MEKVSPITYSTDISRITEFRVSEIISLYEEINIPVARFFKNIESVELYQCNKTGYRYYYPFTIFGDDQFYQDLYNSMPNSYLKSRWEYEQALHVITTNSNVLEIGSGAGVFQRMLREKGCKATGLELNSKAVADSKKDGLEVHGELIETYSVNNEERFDFVCSFQVLEHIMDVRSFITGAIKTLKPGGKLILSVPNSHPYFLKNDKYHTLNLPPHHSGLWDKLALRKLEEEFPLAVLSVNAEPFKDYKEWYQVQKRYYKETSPVLGFLMGLVPRPVYKFFLRAFASRIQGAYLTAIFQKR